MPRKKVEKYEIVKTFELYSGEVKVEFRPNSPRKRYTIFDKNERVRVPSVTAITNRRDKPGLIPWAVENCLTICREKILPDQIHGAQFLEEVWKEAGSKYRDVKKKAADVGTLAHDALERYFTEKDSVPPLADTPVRARYDEAVKWFNGNEVESVAVERPVYSRKYGYCGTLDNISRVKRVLSMLDYKSSRHIYNTYVSQVAAYIKAYEEEMGEHVEQVYILKIDEDRTRPFKYNREQIEIAFEGFLGLLADYNADRFLGKPEEEEVDWISAL